MQSSVSPGKLTRLAALAALLAFGSSVLAQESASRAGGQQQRNEETKVIPTIRTVVYDTLTEAQACLDEGDLECVQDGLRDVERIRDLNNYERANVLNFRAFLAFDQEDFDAAIKAYEDILALPQTDLPDGFIGSTMRNLATLYIQEERYQQGLDTFRRWMALPFVTPAASDYYLLGTIYYQMEEWEAGIEPVRQAISMASDGLGEEAWWQLLFVFYYQLEQTDNVIDVLTVLTENWTKWEWVRQLAGQLSAQGRENDTLTLYEAAYEAGWLTRSSELVQLANLYLAGREPYKAAVLLQSGLDDGSIEGTVSNWRLLAQALQLAAEYDKAIPALRQASQLAEDGELDRQLAQSYARLAQWDNCAQAAQDALDRGGLDRPDFVNMQLGQCLVNQRKYEEARTAFQAAARDDRSERDARRWLSFIETEVARERANAEALASLRP